MTLASKSARAERITPRLPLRADSKLRFQALMAALRRLLAEHGPSDITIQMIAEAARMPTATVYHFFPSAEAALLAQARIYFEDFEAEAVGDTPVEERTSWQNAWRCSAQRSREFFTRDVARMRLLLGADVPRDVQNYDMDFNVRAGRMIVEKFERETFLPHVPGLAEACTNAVEINDTFWRMSFLRTGTITDAYFEEAMRAIIAYLRLYLPEELEYRKP
jgi:AcrR family transcriptional regulator